MLQIFSTTTGMKFRFYGFVNITLNYLDLEENSKTKHKCAHKNLKKSYVFLKNNILGTKYRRALPKNVSVSVVSVA